MEPILFGVGALAIFVLAVVGWRALATDALTTLDVADIALLRDESAKTTRVGIFDRIARRYSPTLGRALGERRIAKIRRRIELAGRPEGISVDSYLQLTVKYIVLLGLCSLLFLMMGMYFVALVLPVGIYFFPMSRLITAARIRQRQIDADLPDFLDILAVTVGAGIGFRQALSRVSTRFPGTLGTEIAHTLRELDVGVTRRQAFTNLRNRCESDAMTAFVGALLQAEELGTPLAVALQQIARDSRREAGQRARQRAARMVPRTTLVVTVFLVPPTILLIGVAFFLGSDIDLGGVAGG